MTAPESFREAFAKAIHDAQETGYEWRSYGSSWWDHMLEVTKPTADAAWAAARREALLEAAERLPAFTEGVSREGTAFWKERDRDVYSLAVEEAQDGLRRMAEEGA